MDGERAAGIWGTLALVALFVALLATVLVAGMGPCRGLCLRAYLVGLLVILWLTAIGLGAASLLAASRMFSR